MVRSSKIAFVRVLDDAPVPEGVPVIVPALRFLADAVDLAQRGAPTGVLWPNNRNIAELGPHLDRLALVALVVPDLPRWPRLQPGAAACASATASRRIARHRPECCATSSCFSCARALIHSRCVKSADAASFSDAVRRYKRFLPASPPTDNCRIPPARGRSSDRVGAAADGSTCDETGMRASALGPRDLLRQRGNCATFLSFRPVARRRHLVMTS
jgi:hypothetical protein